MVLQVVIYTIFRINHRNNSPPRSKTSISFICVEKYNEEKLSNNQQ